MPVLRKLRGFLVFSTLCLISPGRGRLWSPCLAGDDGTVVLNEGLNRQKQCSLYLGGDGLTKTQPRKKSKIICVCLGWRYSPVAEIYASFPQERNKGEEKRSLPGADKTEGHRVELLAMWGIFARKNTYRGCSTPLQPVPHLPQPHKQFWARWQGCMPSHPEHIQNPSLGQLTLGFTYSILPLLHKEIDGQEAVWFPLGGALV